MRARPPMSEEVAYVQCVQLQRFDRFIADFPGALNAKVCSSVCVSAIVSLKIRNIHLLSDPRNPPKELTGSRRLGSILRDQTGVT